MTLQEQYQGKSVLVIGGAGFVGHHLVNRLIELRALVTVADDYSHPSEGAQAHSDAAYTTADAGDEAAMLRVMQYSKPDFIINLAARVAGVLYNQDNQLRMFEDNLDCQMVPLRASQYVTDKIPRYLHISSVCVYGDKFTNPCHDTHQLVALPTEANAGYSWSKRIGELYAGWLPKEYQPVIVRPSNIYGPWDHFGPSGHVIPNLIERIVKPKEPTEVLIYGTGEEIREFIYVEDVVEAMLYALAHGRRGEVYNLGTNGETASTIKDLAKRLCAIMDYKPIFRYNYDKQGGDSIRWSSCVKINELGWQHKISLDEGLKRTVEWYANYRDGLGDDVPLSSADGSPAG